MYCNVHMQLVGADSFFAINHVGQISSLMSLIPIMIVGILLAHTTIPDDLSHASFGFVGGYAYYASMWAVVRIRNL